MGVYFKSLNWPKVVLAVSLSSVLCAAYGNLVLKLPPTMTFTLPIRLVGPVVPAIIVSYLFGQSDQQRKILAVRAVRWLDLATFLMTLGISIVIYVAVKHATIDSHDLAVMRNLISLAGIAIISSHVFGRSRNWVLPISLTLATMVAGVDFQNRPLSWAWLLQPYSDGLSILFSASVIVLALVVTFLNYERN